MPLEHHRSGESPHGLSDGRLVRDEAAFGAILRVMTLLETGSRMISRRFRQAHRLDFKKDLWEVTNHGDARYKPPFATAPKAHAAKSAKINEVILNGRR